MQPRTNPGGAAADQRRPRNINVFETGEDAGRVRGEPLIPGNPRPGLYVWGNNLMRVRVLPDGRQVVTQTYSSIDAGPAAARD